MVARMDSRYGEHLAVLEQGAGMSVVETSVEVDAPRERVWKVVSDPTNMPAWDQHIVAVEGVPPTGLRQGVVYRTVLRFMGVKAHTEVEVLELVPPEYALLRLRGILEGKVETSLHPLDGDRTLLRQRVEYRFIGGPLGGLAARGVKLLGASVLLKRGVLAQKRQAESTS